MKATVYGKLLEHHVGVGHDGKEFKYSSFFDGENVYRVYGDCSDLPVNSDMALDCRITFNHDKRRVYLYRTSI